ncbi:hypothetical protein NLX83_19475 [Allokutzneria sp. A3M-2-11 16]|uniref:hypothetical protein n=1 Tax=Allokutzneria sp. A3M-2-11 16 TaxID=2962043 RepID=UPI0020B82863|nr:hypothetical protein [Allokutzneria sp. A3M-2-11 16]MCP3801442.1 hypothetical protein [Allokutzneria sp. A3M-2-11 16]
MISTKTRRRQGSAGQRPVASSVWIRPARVGEGRQVAALLPNDPSTAELLRSSIEADRADGTNGTELLVLVAIDRKSERMVGMGAAGVPRQWIAALKLPQQAARLVARTMVAVGALSVVPEALPQKLIPRVLNRLADHYRDAGFQWMAGHCATGAPGWLDHLVESGFTVGDKGVGMRLQSALWPIPANLATQQTQHAFFRQLAEEPTVLMTLQGVPLQLRDGAAPTVPAPAAPAPVEQPPAAAPEATPEPAAKAAPKAAPKPAAKSAAKPKAAPAEQTEEQADTIRTVRRRVSAAKGRLTRALDSGDEDRIAAARAHLATLEKQAASLGITN